MASMDTRQDSYLNAHSLEVVQCVNEASNISTMAHLIGVDVVLELCAVDVIICGVAVDKAIEEERIERKSPVIWGGMIFSFVIWPFTPILCRVCCRLILVEVVFQQGLIVGPA